MLVRCVVAKRDQSHVNAAGQRAREVVIAQLGAGVEGPWHAWRDLQES